MSLQNATPSIVHDDRVTPSTSVHVNCRPADDREFAAAVEAAAAMIARDDPAPASAIETIVRGRYPSASVFDRDPVAKLGPGPAIYAFRDGRPARVLPRRVLVVDDNGALVDVIAAALETGRFEVRTAANGAVALEAIRTWTPDLIILDLSMPHMDGPEFGRRYAGLPGPKAPIIVVSGASDAEVQAARIGARSVIGKPFLLEALTGLVERYA